MAFSTLELITVPTVSARSTIVLLTACNFDILPKLWLIRRSRHLHFILLHSTRSHFMIFDQQILLTAVLLMVVIGLYVWVYQISSRINSYAERIWGPSWLTMLLLGIVCFWLGIRTTTDRESFIALCVVCLYISGWFYYLWYAGLHADDIDD